MAKTTRIICLANSRKSRERCVAGREIVKGRIGPWIRPVIGTKGFVDKASRLYADGDEPRLGDVIQLSVRKREERFDHQRENWFVNPKTRWRRTQRLSWTDLLALAEGSEPLFEPSTEIGERNRHNNRIASTDAQQLTSSLRLIHVPRMDVRSLPNRGRHFDGRFSLGGVAYQLRITDPVFSEAESYSAYDRTLGECLLTISLGEPYRHHSSQGPEHCYRLIAGVIERERYDDGLGRADR